MDSDKMRGSGRTTAGILRTIAHALETPDRWVPFIDHSGFMRDDAKEMAEAVCEIIHAIGLFMEVKHSSQNILIRSPLTEIRNHYKGA